MSTVKKVDREVAERSQPEKANNSEILICEVIESLAPCLVLSPERVHR